MTRWQAIFDEILMVYLILDTRTDTHLIRADGQVMQFASAEYAEREAARQNDMEG